MVIAPSTNHLLRSARRRAEAYLAVGMPGVALMRLVRDLGRHAATRQRLTGRVRLRARVLEKQPCVRSVRRLVAVLTREEE